jgi:cytochrome c553
MTLACAACDRPVSRTDEALSASGRLVAMSGGAGGAANACFSCHGLDGAGDGVSTPRLAGLEAGYLLKQMNA